MSLNNLTSVDLPQPFPLLCKSLSVQGDFGYDDGEREPDRVLALQRVDQYHDLVIWENLNIGASSVYANQAELILRTASYVDDNSDMFFDGFKFTPPAFVNLRDDKKSIVISSEGWYYAVLTVCSTTLEDSTKYELTLDDTAIPGATITSQPSMIGYGAASQHITTTTSCIFKCIAGTNTLRLQILPRVVTNVVSDASSLTIVKLFANI